MPKEKLSNFRQRVIYALTVFGTIFLVISAFYASSFITMLALSLIFWGIILIYLSPIKNVPSTILNVALEANNSNLERILTELNLSEKAIYLAPQKLSDADSSLIFIPLNSIIAPTDSQETNQSLFVKEKGVFLTPPGFFLSQLLEQELGMPFTRTNLVDLPRILPKLLVEELDLASDVDLQIEKDMIMIKIVGSVLTEDCKQTDSYHRTYQQIGFLLSSALACVLAKSAGKSIIIQKESNNPENNTTVIEFQIKED
jgi:hypothetical protein